MVQTPVRPKLAGADVLARVKPRPIERTAAAGLKPSVNMDTGYVNLLTDDEREQVLRVTGEVMRGRPFVAGAFIEGQSGDPVALYCREAERVRARGGTPILFQCSALKARPEREVVAVYRAVAERLGPIIGFELGEMFAPFGWIFSLETFAELIQIPGLVGIKHSSLDRELEWQRLELRDRVQPEFRIYT